MEKTSAFGKNELLGSTFYDCCALRMLTNENACTYIMHWRQRAGVKILIVRDISYSPFNMCTCFRKLYLFISMLVHGDGDGKSDVSISKDNETLSLLNSIFLCIKRSEDAFDTTKSQVWYINATRLFLSVFWSSLVFRGGKIYPLLEKINCLH